MKVTIEHRGKIYHYNDTFNAFVFLAAINTGYGEEHGGKDLEKFFNKLYACYLKDEQDANIARLADFLSENWEECRSQTENEILEDFYIVNS